MFKIGDFARLSRVPVKTLRYYDEIGLLKPLDVDRFTRYRYYAAEQLARLNRILVLKELGFSLEQIGQLLTDDLTPEQLRGMLRLRRAEVEQQVQSARLQMAQIDLRLSQIEQEGRLPEYEVVVRPVEAQRVASLAGSIPSYDQAEPIFDHLFGEVAAYLAQQGTRPAGPGIALYHPAPSPDEPSPVEAALPIAPENSSGPAAPLPAHPRIQLYTLPAEQSMACVVHHGSFAAIGAAYQALLSWLDAQGFHSSGPTREVYLHHAPHAGQARFITEIQFPIQSIRKEKTPMQPKFVTLDAFKIVGMQYLGKNENNEIAQVWDQFVPRIPEMRHIAPGEEVSYGMCYPNEQGIVDYVASLPVTELADIPPGMVGRQVPAQTYAVFEVHGLADLPAAYRRIEAWFPTSGYQPAGGPDFEFYPESFDPADPQSLLYIYFPVKTG